MKVSIEKNYPIYDVVSFLLSSNNEKVIGRYFRNIVYPDLITQQTFSKFSIVDSGIVFFFEDLQSAIVFSKSIVKFQDSFLQLGTKFKKRSDVERAQCLNSIIKQGECLSLYLDYAKRFGYLDRIVSPASIMGIFLANTQWEHVATSTEPKVLMPKPIVKQALLERIRNLVWRYLLLSLALTILSYFALGGKELQKKIENI